MMVAQVKVLLDRDADDNHCQAVAALAVGDINSGRTGVAPDADIILSSIPETWHAY